MILNTKQKGKYTELQCMAAFIDAGYSVSVPYGDDSRYDFIADIDGKLLRVQVKTSSLKSNTTDAIVFCCRSTRVNCTETKNVRYTKSEIDFFATFWNNKCYLVPVQECAVEKTLRFSAPKNGQLKGISFANDYELEKQIVEINKKDKKFN